MIKRNPIPPSRLYSLPFEKDTFKLTFKTLNDHCKFGLTKVPSWSFEIRKISYSHEFLTLGIKFQLEKEENVYLKVASNELLVSCSVDTDNTYLSRYAYFAIHRLMSIYDYINFEKYYWPDFFNGKDGSSKYINVINDREGLDISFKPQFASFYKPGQELIYPKIGFERTRPLLIMRSKESIATQEMNGVGFCIADTGIQSYQYNHYPLLMPFYGTLAQNNKSIKSFKNFLHTPADFDNSHLSPIQIKLCEIAIKMRGLAKVNISYRNSPQEKVADQNENTKRFYYLYYLWKSAMCYLPFQSNMYYYTSWGLRDLMRKPQKRRMVPCSIAYDVPQMCFIWKDRGEYYELEYRFKVGDKTMVPDETNTAFFITERNNPLKFYLFDSASDAEISWFFALRKFKILVLKKHYAEHFEHFLKELRNSYMVRDID